MFTCPYTGLDKIESLVPSKRTLQNGKKVILFVHPQYKNEQFLNRGLSTEDDLSEAFRKRKR